MCDIDSDALLFVTNKTVLQSHFKNLTLAMVSYFAKHNDKTVCHINACPLRTQQQRDTNAPTHFNAQSVTQNEVHTLQTKHLKAC